MNSVKRHLLCVSASFVFAISTTFAQVSGEPDNLDENALFAEIDESINEPIVSAGTEYTISDMALAQNIKTDDAEEDTEETIDNSIVNITESISLEEMEEDTDEIEDDDLESEFDDEFENLIDD